MILSMVWITVCTSSMAPYFKYIKFSTMNRAKSTSTGAVASRLCESRSRRLTRLLRNRRRKRFLVLISPYNGLINDTGSSFSIWYPNFSIDFRNHTFDRVQDTFAVIEHFLHCMGISSFDDMFVTHNRPNSTARRNLADSRNGTCFQCHKHRKPLYISINFPGQTSFGAASPPRTILSNTSVPAIASCIESLKAQAMISSK